MTNEQTSILQDIIFHTVPGDLGERLSDFRADMEKAYTSADDEGKADIAETIAESAIDLKSVLADWNLKCSDTYGDAVATDDQLDEQYEANVALLKDLGANDEAKRVEDEVAHLAESNLVKMTRMTMAGDLNTWWGNDYAVGLRKAMQKGAILVTTNPVLVDIARHEQPEVWTPVRDELREKYGEGCDPVTLAYAMTIQVVLTNARLLRPIWEITDGALGYVSLQLNPKEATNADKMVDEATWVYGQIEDELGGEPNTVFKVPGTAAGIEAAERMTADGMGVNVTVNYALPQQIAFAGAIEANSTAKVSFRTQMDGRLDDPVGEQLKELGLEDWEEVKKWATTAIRQREYHMLNHPPQEGGLGFNKSYPLAASGRGAWNIERGTNNGPVPNFLTIFPDKAEEYDSKPREIDPDGIWTELPDGYLDKLMKSSIFRQAYEPDGMMPEEFIDFVPAVSTLTGFSETYEEFLEWVCEG
ncbi:MAG: transaldolase family protein [Armatimonadota bacterium]